MAAASASSTASGPLAGVRVLDLTSVVLGPMATQILGDYGADVVKLESIDGDLLRTAGISRQRGQSALFLSFNRNKRSLAIDLKHPAGVDAVRRLLPTVDVLVHNMRIRPMERLGLGYEAVAAIHPGIVYCVATGFDQAGPDRDRPAFDDVIQAACGLASLIGHERDSPEFAPALIADKTAGLATANAVLAALFHRQRTGEGQYIEVPMFETMAAFTLSEHLGGLTYDPPLGPAGYDRILSGGRRPAPTLDGFVAMLPYTATHWIDFFGAAGRQDVLDRYDFHDRHQRSARVHELYADMVGVTGQMTTAECLALCDRLDIPATRIWSFDELPSHPQLQAVGLFQRMEHPTEGAVVTLRPSVKFARTPAALRRAAPLLGQHTMEILLEAGLDPPGIEALLRSGVVRLADDG